MSRPGDCDLSTQEPFYCLIVKPGVEHMQEQPSGAWTPDSSTGAYHSPFSYVDPDNGVTWNGQKCWVKGDSTALGTVQCWVHEMAEAYSTAGEISDKCQSNGPVLVDGVSPAVLVGSQQFLLAACGSHQEVRPGAKCEDREKQVHQKTVSSAAVIASSAASSSATETTAARCARDNKSDPAK